MSFLRVAFALVVVLAVAKADDLDEMFRKAEQRGISDDLVQNEVLNLTFTCAVAQSPSVPTSVHSLRPSDIKIVAALGDSVTAALGALATNILQASTEWPGVSWSGGAKDSYETVQTLPNILRKFNPNVYGGASGSGTCAMHSECAYRVFDAGVSGAVGNDMPGQLTNLTALMKADPNVDFENDWKVITMWIGANDLCRSCNGVAFNQPAVYAEKVEEAIAQLVATIPNVYVNLVSIIDVNRINEITSGLCGWFHEQACHCVTDSQESADIVTQKAKEMQAALETIASKFQNSDTYTVEYQPFFINTDIPDRSYLAQDCFHLTLKAHSACAIALWNNMLQPVGAKATSWVPGEDIICPSEAQPYLCTAKNNCGAAQN